MLARVAILAPQQEQEYRTLVFYSWWSMVGLLSQIRIAGSALVLSSSHPDKPMLIAESILQSVGLSPLLFEVSLILLRCGQSGETGPANSKWTKLIRFALHFFRFPIFIAITLAVVSGCINMRTLGEAGSIVLVVTFAYVCGLVGWLAIKSRSILPESGHHAVFLTLLTLSRASLSILVAFHTARKSLIAL
ncbi:hypothetical protein N7489_006303 [Penicillium chrysogenum]|uniref:uncharacterized protein n=1 Tax=Penicillium chrysogenum TaxID=5076 RepID=UPI0023A548D1|nr:uncharacterized protein N7489_006303 [Penicillium chrysogenum]KAJ5236212.1 hypothetical protein N7489_006303 [Penicillium chrysogenum]KAJ5276151.1 hypothetical protein N7524_002304 [Penicillium chrysogenum]KAJ6153086.1 hypothetical protein N7497_007405 [Penicillium chrysogenum]